MRRRNAQVLRCGESGARGKHPWLPYKLPYSEASLKLAKSARVRRRRPVLGRVSDDRYVYTSAEPLKVIYMYTGSSIASEYWGCSAKAGPPHSPSTDYFAWKKNASC